MRSRILVAAWLWGLGSAPTVRASDLGAFVPGQLDPTFSGDGWAIVAFDFEPWVAGYASRVLASPDGRVLVAGEAQYGPPRIDSDFAIARLTSSGELDPEFDGDGRFTVGFDLGGLGSGNDGASALALAPNGSVIAAGVAEYAYEEFEAVAARIRPGAGSSWELDPSFAGDGKLIWSAASPPALFWRVVDANVMEDGRSVAAGLGAASAADPSVPWVARMLPTSSDDPLALDPTFGESGVFLFGDSSVYRDIWSLDVDAQGRAVAGGVTLGDNGAVFVLRLLPSGELDPSFAGVGWRTVELPNHMQESAESVAVAADGSVVLGGSAWLPGGDGGVMVVRLLESGDLDPQFGTDGAVLIPPAVTGEIAEGRAVALQGDGRVVVGGALIGDGDEFFALRLDRDGALDPTFGEGGIARLPVGPDGRPPEGGAYDLALQPDGRILLVGTCMRVLPPNGRTDDFCVARLENDYVFADGFEGGSTGAWSPQFSSGGSRGRTAARGNSGSP